MRKPYMIVALLTGVVLIAGYSSCRDKCSDLNEEFKKIVAQGAELGQDDLFQPDGLNRVQNLAQRMSELQVKYVQTECPIPEAMKHL